MEYEKIPFLCGRTLLIILVLAMTGSKSNGAICPAACRCENDVLRTSCASASLEFVPIQLNPELHELDLSRNKIVHIHFSFPFYEELIVLNLSHNKIKTLGNSNFLSQKNLTHLDLQYNQIENLTKESFKGLKALSHLDVSNNSLEVIQETTFRDLHSLVVLRLAGNKLVHLEAGLFRSGKNLKEIYLNDNQFLEIPTEALADTVRLRYLSLSRNYIRYIEDGAMPNLPELHTLLLNYNIVTEIHPDGLSTLISLMYLDLSNNNLTVMPTESLAKLSNLTTLTLSGNFITVLQPISFRGLFNLKILKINRLMTLKQIDVRTFVDNINLEKINMDYNLGIIKLPTRLFHGNSKLTYVSVRFNGLQNLEAIHFPLDQLHELRLGGNPLQCNCSLGWLWQLIQSYKTKSINTSTNTKSEKLIPNIDLILDEHDIICEGPEDLHGKHLSSATKHQMDCSVGWLAAISVTITVIFILVVIGGVVYWAPKRRTKSSREEKLRSSLPEPNIPRKSDSYEAAQIEKYILQPSMMIHNEYRTLTPWDPYGPSVVNIYEQINDNRERPHIVYV